MIPCGPNKTHLAMGGCLPFCKFHNGKFYWLLSLTNAGSACIFSALKIPARAAALHCECYVERKSSHCFLLNSLLPGVNLNVDEHAPVLLINDQQWHLLEKGWQQCQNICPEIQTNHTLSRGDALSKDTEHPWLFSYIKWQISEPTMEISSLNYCSQLVVVWTSASY